MNTKTKLSIEEKIDVLEKYSMQGIDICSLPKDYISEDNIMVDNVITNLKKFFSNNSLNTVQISRCEKIGIRLIPDEVDADYEIVFLKRAMDEGIDLSQKAINAEDGCLIYKFINNLREDYKNSKLSDLQIKECIDTLKIFLPKQEIIDILNDNIRRSALKNIITSNDTNL